MNIELADYETVIQLGTRDDFETKLKMNGQTFEEVVNLSNESGLSLLGRCLVSRKFDMAKEFLSRNANVNVVTKEGFNEFHLIAANLRYEGALDVAKMLLDRGVSLTAQDKKFGNTAFFTLCIESYKVRTTECMDFIRSCFERIDDIDVCNKAGISIRKLIEQGMDEGLVKIMEEKQ